MRVFGETLRFGFNDAERAAEAARQADIKRRQNEADRQVTGFNLACIGLLVLAAAAVAITAARSLGWF